MSETRPVYIACASGTNAQTDVLVERRGSLVRLLGRPQMDFTGKDAYALSKAILAAIDPEERLPFRRRENAEKRPCRRSEGHWRADLLPRTADALPVLAVQRLVEHRRWPQLRRLFLPALRALAGGGALKPRWIVYSRSGDTYPVALDTALDWNHARELLAHRLLPGPFETIRCSSFETAQRIADWMNQQVDEGADDEE